MKPPASHSSIWSPEMASPGIPFQRVQSPLERWLRDAAARLGDHSDTPRLDAELLAAHALGMSREEMILRMPAAAVPEGLDALLARRLTREPIARDFWSLSFKVTPDVLVPRPDSETLIEAALDHFEGREGPTRILDLGTGSGALLLTALDLWPRATGLGIDISPAALAVARDNAQANGLADRTQLRTGDWAMDVDERFDLILCNPPYICDDVVLAPDVADYEPALALFGGVDGLDPYRILAPQIRALLAPGGVALFEIGYDQGETALALFRAESLTVSLRHDLGDNPRCLIVTVPEKTASAPSL
jgi:release factor glutamine methyltransferase